MRKVKWLKGLLAAGLILILAACGNASSPGAAQPENAEWPKVLNIVQMPNENNPQAASMHSQLRDYLKEELGVEVKEYEGSSYAIGIEALASNKLDIMLATPMSYYQANQLSDAELLVTPQMESGQYFTAFIAKGDNDDINSIEDLKGKNFAFVNAASSSGYLYPKGTLVQEFDLDPELVEQSGYFFENVVFSESHPNSVIGVAMGDFEAAAAASGTIQAMIDAGTIKEGDVKVIGRTQDIPDPSYIIRGNLPEDFKEAVRKAFLSFDNEAYFEAIHGDPNVRFIASDPNYYDPAIEMLAAIKALEEE